MVSFIVRRPELDRRKQGVMSGRWCHEAAVLEYGVPENATCNVVRALSIFPEHAVRADSGSHPERLRGLRRRHDLHAAAPAGDRACPAGRPRGAKDGVPLAGSYAARSVTWGAAAARIAEGQAAIGLDAGSGDDEGQDSQQPG